jgi:EAL domain-containing protein (putative c-di-GMP-specific phosphodiesterase class I)
MQHPARPLGDGRTDAEAVARAIRHDAIAAVVQPVVQLDSGATVGFEALARIGDRAEGPSRWLDRASDAGLRVELELACLRAAVRLGPPPGDSLLFVNVSPVTLADHRVDEVCADLAGRLVVEITERDRVDDYDALRRWRDTWRGHGVALAVDDTGAGHATLRHVLELEPDYVKLDRELVANLDEQRPRWALIAALRVFADEVGAMVVAEGVERPEEVQSLVSAGVHLAQGFVLGRPDRTWSPGRLPVPA